MKKTHPAIWILSFVAAALLALALLDLRNVVIKNREASSLAATVEEKVEEEAVVHSVKILRQRSGEVVEEFEGLVLTDDTLVPTIELIESAGRRLGLDVEIASVDKVDSDPELSKVSLVVETKGSWAGTVLFLKAIENLPHRVMVDNIYLSKAGDQWRASVAISLYSFK